MSDRPVIESRAGRLFMFVQYNRHQLLVDAAVVLAWIIGSGIVFRWLALPQWLYYLVLFIGIFFYGKLTPGWERPYRSPD